MHHPRISIAPLLLCAALMPSLSQAPTDTAHPLQTATSSYLESFYLQKTTDTPTPTSATNASNSATSSNPAPHSSTTATKQPTAQKRALIARKQHAPANTTQHAPHPALPPTIALELHAITHSKSEWTVFLAIDGILQTFKNGDITPCGPIHVISPSTIQVGQKLLQI